MTFFRVAGVALAIALAGLSACGDDTQSLFELPSPGKPATLVGTWEARQPHGYKLRYVFRRDGTYSHASGVRGRRKSGTYRLAIRRGARSRCAVAHWC